jgi:23S rRNA (cytidine1920-2'-O)/16S rRNA (cytidine1409-2'-O)-methyltransferase
MPAARLDQMLVTRGLAESREKAQRLIRAGQVRVNGQTATKPGHDYPDDVTVEVEAPERFVSRGGEKLEEAFRCFQPMVEGLICLDVGASTGGFTDCLLQHGAARVYAVDVGKGQLHWKIRTDPRVVVFEGVNARFLETRSLPETPAFAVIDVSFISLTKILPAVQQILAGGGHIISLIKPQFEAGRSKVERGGVVRDPAVHEEVIENVKAFGIQSVGLEFLGICRSPILGPAGNVEFLAYWKKP